MDSNWTIVSHKKLKSKKKITNPKSNYDIIDIIDIIINTIREDKLNPEYIFLYGSRARKTNRINSDVDLIVFWKYPIPTIKQILYLKELLINNLGLNIDFVNMYITNKNIIVHNEKTICYYDNVTNDAICIYKKNGSNTISIADLFNISERVKR